MQPAAQRPAIMAATLVAMRLATDVANSTHTATHTAMNRARPAAMRHAVYVQSAPLVPHGKESATRQ